MKTNFFEQLESILNVGAVHITIEKNQGVCSVLLNVVPKKDIGQTIPPIVLTATAAELDESFFEVYSSEIQKKTVGIIENVATYNTMLKSVEEAAKKKLEDKTAKKKTTTVSSTPAKPSPQVEDEDDDLEDEPTDNTVAAPAPVKQIEPQISLL